MATAAIHLVEGWEDREDERCRTLASTAGVINAAHGGVVGCRATGAQPPALRPRAPPFVVRPSVEDGCTNSPEVPLVLVSPPSDPVLRIDCDECALQDTDACSDCIITFLCGTEASTPVVVDLAEARAMRLLDEGGLAPPLRHVRSTG